jgi:hypothetical protein
MDPRVHRLRFAWRCLEDDEWYRHFRQSQTLVIDVSSNNVVILEASPSEAEAMNSGIHASDSVKPEPTKVEADRTHCGELD